jgi:hypothetical protein
MAQAPTKTGTTRARKKVKKSVSEGIAHIHASFNTITRSQTGRATRCRGGVRAAPLRGLAQVDAVRRLSRRAGRRARRRRNAASTSR